MQREAGRQGFSSSGLYRIDEFQVLRLFERVVPRGVVFARLSTVRHQFRGGSCIRPRHYNLNFHSSQTAATFDASRGGATRPSQINLRYVARRGLVPRDGGVFLMINVDSRVDNECPPNQNGNVDWPLRRVANKDNTEHHNDKQKGDGGPT
jgi:hypothetical protein